MSVFEASPAEDNAVFALLNRNHFYRDLARAVTNSGNVDMAAAWLLGQARHFLAAQGQPAGPIAAFDFAVYDFEALAGLWPAVRRAAVPFAQRGLDTRRGLADLARYLCERLPTVWSRPAAFHTRSVSRALYMADTIDTLVGLFCAGERPTGSKDPLAIRRATLGLLGQICFPLTITEMT